MLTIERRNGLKETTHEGHIAVVDKDGLVSSYNDPYYKTFMRSSAKPVQLLPTIMAKLHEKYHLNSTEIAIMSASHMGEEIHVKTLLSIMEKTGLKESDLLMKPAFPGNPEAREAAIRGDGKRKLYHNCSGKHLNLLLYHREMTGKCEGYHLKDSPAFKAINEYMLKLTETPSLQYGVDGCGVPVFYLPIYNMAKLFLKLANPDLLEDEKLISAIKLITKSIHENPVLISGHDKICSLIDEDENLFAKGGARGIYCFGLKKESLGFAVKVEDGNADSWPFVVVELLKKYSPNSKTIKLLEEKFPREIKNDNQLVVGDVVTDFTLK